MNKEDIYWQLRRHSKSSKTLVEEIFHISPGDSPRERLKNAQIGVVSYVIEKYRGNTKSFLEDYDNNKISRTDIAEHMGKKFLDKILI